MLRNWAFFHNLNWNSCILCIIRNFTSDAFFVYWNQLFYIFFLSLNTILKSYQKLNHNFNILSKSLNVKFSIINAVFFKNARECLLRKGSDGECSNVVFWISNMFPFIKWALCEFLIKVNILVIKHTCSFHCF